VSSTAGDRVLGIARERFDAGAYFAGTVFQRASLFLAVPFLLRSLAAAEYGVFGLLQSAVTLLPAVLALNIPIGITRLLFDGRTPPERGGIAFKLSVLSAGIGLVAALALWSCAASAQGAVAALLGVPQQEAIPATTLVLVGALGSNHLQMAWGIWRAENRSLPTAIATAGSGLLFLLAIAFLAATHRLGVITAIGAYAGATALIGVASNIIAILDGPGRGATSYSILARRALSYGLPVLPYVLAVWGVAAGGRWIARATLTLEDTGRFTLASQLAIMIGIIGRSAFDAWAPRSFEMFARGDAEAARHYLRARGALTLAVVGTASAITAVVLGVGLPRFAPAYAGVTLLFPLMALAPMLDVAYFTYHWELMGLKVTEPIGTYATITVLAFVAAGVAAAKLFGLWGLAAAYTGAYALQWTLARRAVRAVRAEPTRRPEGAGRAVLPDSTPLD